MNLKRVASFKYYRWRKLEAWPASMKEVEQQPVKYVVSSSGEFSFACILNEQAEFEDLIRT